MRLPSASPRLLRAWAALVVGLAATSIASTAMAHGRPPRVGELHLDPGDPDRIVARSTWGLVQSDDGGETWRWVCAVAIGFDPTLEDPAFAITEGSTLLFGTFTGLTRSSDDRCTWEVPAPVVDRRYVIDLETEAGSPADLLAVVTSGISDDLLLRSDDGGVRYEEMQRFDDVLLERVTIAPSDVGRVYLSGARLSEDRTDREGVLLRSEDGGRTFEEATIELDDGERNVFVLAVDPTDPGRLWARVVRRITDTRDERLLLSEDGGRSFRTVAGARELSGVAVASDGSVVWAASGNGGGLLRSVDGGRSFETIHADLDVLCLEARGTSELWLCVNELIDGYAIGRSLDAGDTLEPMFVFADTGALPACPACTPVDVICPQWIPDLVADLDLDAGIELPDAATGLPRDIGVPERCSHLFDAGPDTTPPATGCGCRAAGRGPAAPPALASVALLGLVLARRRRRGR
ncbi:MAG: WD40/YVTN/BNR-like repeat-containing protein [Sandaracinaceae bacterium]